MAHVGSALESVQSVAAATAEAAAEPSIIHLDDAASHRQQQQSRVRAIAGRVSQCQAIK